MEERLFIENHKRLTLVKVSVHSFPQVINLAFLPNVSQSKYLSLDYSGLIHYIIKNLSLEYSRLKFFKVKNIIHI